MIPLAAIHTDDAYQTRVTVRRSVVRQYAEAMTQQLREGGLHFPAVVAFTDGTHYWLGDGYHRVLAAREAGLSEILAEVRPGGPREALLHGISANAEHGLPLTRADKRRVVALVLNDPEWSHWSDREIAQRCLVGNNMVSSLRKSASVRNAQMRERKVRRGGRVYEMTVNQADAEVVKEDAQPAQESTPAQPVALAVVDDRLGIPVPQSRWPVFATTPDFEEARQLFAQLAEVVNRIAQQPGGALYRQHLRRKVEGTRTTFECGELRAAMVKLLTAEPYCAYCPLCHLSMLGCGNPTCQVCQGRGWTTQAGFAACPEGHQQAILRLKEQKTA
jgi:hypothetical protein